MTARLSPVPADWEKGRALPRPCRGCLSLLRAVGAVRDVQPSGWGAGGGCPCACRIRFDFFFNYFLLFFFLIFEGIFLIVVAAAAAASWLSVAWMFVSFVQTLHVPRGGEKGTPTRCPSEHQPISFHCL